MLVFPRARMGDVINGKITGICLLPTQHVRVDTVRYLYRTYIPRGDDCPYQGPAATHRKTPAAVVERASIWNRTERFDPVVTIRSIEVIEDALVDLARARVCGYKTAVDLRTTWRAAHPRSPLIQLVRFDYGDTRDIPLFLAATSLFKPGVQGDYTPSLSRAVDEAEVLTDGEYSTFATHARQKDVRRQADAQQTLAKGSLAARTEQVENADLEGQRATRHERRIMEARIERFERRLE